MQNATNNLARYIGEYPWAFVPAFVLIFAQYTTLAYFIACRDDGVVPVLGSKRLHIAGRILCILIAAGNLLLVSRLWATSLCMPFLWGPIVEFWWCHGWTWSREEKRSLENHLSAFFSLELLLFIIDMFLWSTVTSF